MNIEKAREIANKYISSDGLKFEQVDTGGDSTTFKIVSPEGNFFLRTGGMRSNYDVEHEVLKILLENGVRVPVPEAVGIDVDFPENSFSLQKRVQGVALFGSDIEKEKWPDILREVGRNLKLVYSLQFDGFGHLSPEKFRKTGKLEPNYSSLSDFVMYYFTARIELLVKRIRADEKNGFKGSSLTRKQIDKVLKIVSKIPEAQKRVDEVLSGAKIDSRLVHGDPSTQHIMVKNDKFSGLIDFNNTLVCDPLFDIAYFSIMPDGEYYPYLLETSGVEMDRERFDFYRMLISIGKIHTRYIRHNYLNEYPEVLDYALEELNK